MFEPKATAPHLDSTKRASLSISRSLPVFPGEQTLRLPFGMSQRCQQPTSGQSFDQLVGANSDGGAVRPSILAVLRLMLAQFSSLVAPAGPQLSGH
jgi:hypothetical protein